MTSVGVTKIMHQCGKKPEFPSARKQEIKPYWTAVKEVETGFELLAWNANIQDLHKNVLELTAMHNNNLSPLFGKLISKY